MLMSTSTKWTNVMENDSEVLSGSVVTRIRDGRCRDFAGFGGWCLIDWRAG